MTEFAMQAITRVGVASLFLTFSGLATLGALTALRCRSPRTHSAAWCLVLAQGWIVTSLTLSVPWYEPRSQTPPSFGGKVPELSTLVLDSDRFQSRPADPIGTVELSASASDSPGAAEESRPLYSYWPLLVLGIWVAGILLMLARWIREYLGFVQRVAYEECDLDAWQNQWRGVLRDLGIAKGIPLCVSRNAGPMLCRLPRGYRVVVPFRLWQRLGESERELILRHELAHYQRGDVLKSLAVHVLALPHWFNPVAWLAVRRFECSMEWACDDAAQSSRSDPTMYAKALLAIGEHETGQLAGTSAGHGGALPERIRRVLSTANHREPNAFFVIVLLVGLVLLQMLRVKLVAQEPGTPNAVQSETGSTASPQLGTSLKDLIAGLEASEQAIRNLSVTTQCQRSKKYSEAELRARFETQSEPVSESSNSFKEHWIIDSTGRGWNKAIGKSILIISGKRVERLIDTEHTYDGRHERSIRGRKTAEGEVSLPGGSTRTLLSPIGANLLLSLPRPILEPRSVKSSVLAAAGSWARTFGMATRSSSPIRMWSRMPRASTSSSFGWIPTAIILSSGGAVCREVKGMRTGE